MILQLYAESEKIERSLDWCRRTAPCLPGVRDCTDYRERMLGTGREFQGVNGCLIFNFYMVIIKDVQLVRVGIK